METSSLQTAYAAFLEAASSRFVKPADSAKWSAELIVAHIIAIDQLLAATVSELLAGRAPQMDNRPAIREPHLRAIAAAAGDLTGLIALARQSSAVVCTLVKEVDAATADRPFPVRFQSGEDVLVDQPLSLATLIEVQAHQHLPGHMRQLQALTAPSQIK